ncbi:hypothetical protein AVEN_97163-1 [Araneus ventricosus]|uniref:Uncharacterized protein n=1 Tax=Araneus ventricosus TaxID=182803 RepID=A0A4Y2DCY7_ARAVE|nr:hypothetical protein AVEN_97163-1 [Araneus ventricosus]
MQPQSSWSVSCLPLSFARVLDWYRIQTNFFSAEHSTDVDYSQHSFAMSCFADVNGVDSDSYDMRQMRYADFGIHCASCERKKMRRHNSKRHGVHLNIIGKDNLIWIVV